MTLLESLEATLPAPFEERIYRALHPDLQRMSDDQLRSHYERHGMREGRRSHSIVDRRAFVGLIPRSTDALEIGPFHNPLLTGERVRYFDVLDRAGLTERAALIGYPTDRVPEIAFVSPQGDLGVVDETFDVVLSSHVIEHQPDVIGHLRAVERIVRPGGFYFLLVPDKNYCFDHFFAESTIAEMLDAHHSGRKIHTLRSQIEHRALTTHNDVARHWSGDHGAPQDRKGRIARALARYMEDPVKYVDVHAWHFSPTSVRDALQLLRELEYTRFITARIYPTLTNSNEFWAVLKAQPH